MTILLTIASILALTSLAWAARKFTALPVCPICAGVAGTWLWMLAARALGVTIDATVLALLLGATVAGAAYQLEQRLPAGRSPLAWKAVFVPVGFVAAYGLLVPNWIVAGAGIAALCVVTWLFLVPPRNAARDEGAIEALEKQMKRCC